VSKPDDATVRRQQTTTCSTHIGKDVKVKFSVLTAIHSDINDN